MPRLAVAREGQIDAIYGESCALWGAGLDPRSYRDLWAELSRTPWGRKYARFHVWLDDDDRVLSSLKLYRPVLRVLGREERATVIGAVFTPADRRGHGHATALLRAALELGRSRDEATALLFSDIGTEYYEALGFRALPAEEQWGRLPAAPTADPGGWVLREMLDSDAESVRRAHDDFCADRPLAMLRDAEHWQFLGARSDGYFRRLHDPRIGERRQVALHRGRFAGYLFSVGDRRDWNVREVGAVGGDSRTMATILRLGAADARASGRRTFYGWIPPAVRSHLGPWKIRNRRRRRAVPMMRVPDGEPGAEALATPERAYLPYQDQF